MKINKKLFVPFLSSVIGLSIAGGLGGAFAWYQYNSQVTTSFIGSSVADTSILQIGHNEQVEDTPGSGTYHAEMKWGRDFYPYSNNKQDMIPVTFGELKTISEKPNCLREEGGVNKAFGYPNAGKEVNNDYDGWVHIDPNDGFVQYDMYLRALDGDGSQKAMPVYLSDVLIEAAGIAAGDKDIAKAVRIHLNVEGTEKNRLISKEAVNQLPLFGELDLDGDGEADKAGGYISGEAVIPGGDPIIYGVKDETQTTVAAGTIAQSDMSNPDTTYKICTTKEGTATVKITVTVWLEGWELLKIDEQGHTSNIWKPAYSAGVDVRLGMTFATVPVK